MQNHNTEPWWQTACREFLRTTFDLNYIRIIYEFVPFQDPNIPCDELAKRSLGDLKALLEYSLLGTFSVQETRSKMEMAEAILQQYNKAGRRLVPSSLMPMPFYLMTAYMSEDLVIEQIDRSITKYFLDIGLRAWLRFSAGLQDDNVAGFFKEVDHIRSITNMDIEGSQRSLMKRDSAQVPCNIRNLAQVFTAVAAQKVLSSSVIRADK